MLESQSLENKYSVSIVWNRPLIAIIKDLQKTKSYIKTPCNQAMDLLGWNLESKSLVKMIAGAFQTQDRAILIFFHSKPFNLQKSQISLGFPNLPQEKTRILDYRRNFLNDFNKDIKKLEEEQFVLNNIAYSYQQETFTLKKPVTFLAIFTTTLSLSLIFPFEIWFGGFNLLSLIKILISFILGFLSYRVQKKDSKNKEYTLKFLA